MKALYGAIRAADLSQWHRDPWVELRVALLHFERSNRGHRHLLDDGRLIAAARYRHVADPGLASRGLNLRRGTQHLMHCLFALGPGELPGDKHFQALWTAPDPTGLLAHLCRQALESPGYYQKRLPQELLLRSAALRDTPSGLTLSFQICAHRSREMFGHTSATLELGRCDLSTLEGCWRALRDAQRRFSDLAQTLPKLPVFSEVSYREAILTDAHRRIEQALKGMSPQARQLLADYWHRLRPTAQPSHL